MLGVESFVGANTNANFHVLYFVVLQIEDCFFFSRACAVGVVMLKPPQCSEEEKMPFFDRS